MRCPSCNRPYFFLASRGARCRRCGFESATVAWPSYGGYHERRFGGRKAYFERTPRTDPQMREVLAALKLEPGMRVLDLGCGVGDYCAELERMGCEAVGVDRWLEPARLGPPSLVLARMDAARLGFSSQSFDRVCCVNTIEHVREPEALLGEARRVLKKGGRAVFTTFDYEFSFHRFLYDDTHLHEWTLAEFRSLVERYFAVVELYRSGSMFRYYPLNLLAARLLKPEILLIAQKP